MRTSARGSGTAGRSGSRSTSSRVRRRSRSCGSSTPTSRTRCATRSRRAVHIEGGSHSTGDRHALLVDKSACRLYELYDLHHTAHGWKAGSGATWSLALRRAPAGRVDVGRRRRAADLPRARAVGRGVGGRDRPRAPLHRAEDASRVCLSRPALRVELEEHVTPADGPARAAEGKRRHLRVPAAGPCRA